MVSTGTQTEAPLPFAPEASESDAESDRKGSAPPEGEIFSAQYSDDEDYYKPVHSYRDPPEFESSDDDDDDDNDDDDSTPSSDEELDYGEAYIVYRRTVSFKHAVIKKMGEPSKTWKEAKRSLRREARYDNRQI